MTSRAAAAFSSRMVTVWPVRRVVMMCLAEDVGDVEVGRFPPRFGAGGLLVGEGPNRLPVHLAGGYRHQLPFRASAAR